MRRTAIALFVAALLSATAFARSLGDADKKSVTNKKCPVMGTDVNAQVRLEHKGQFVYFCCGGCSSKFKSDPDKHIANLSKEDQGAIKANTECPMTKEPVNKELFLEHEGAKVYFCCENCVESFKTKHAEKKSS